MIDGKYNVEMDTPLGHKKGTVEMTTEGDTVYADIHAPIIGKKRATGHVEGDTFTAEGTFKVPLVGKITYSLRGEVVGDDMRISIDSSKGQFEIAGKRA